MKKDFHRKNLQIFISYIATQKRRFLIDSVCAILAALVDLLFPYASRLSLNHLLPEKNFSAFFAVMALLVLSYVLKAILNYIITVVGHRMGVLVEAEMRRDVFTHIQELSFSFYDQNRTGVLMSRITSDLFEITELSHHGPENLLICGFTMIGAIIIMFTLEWRLALTLTLILPLCMWFVLSQRSRMKKANIEVKRKTAEIFAAIESSISGVRTVKAFANEQKENDKFDRTNEKFIGTKVEFYRAMGMFQSGMEFTTGIMPVVVIAVGGYLMMRGTLDYVDLVTFTLYVSIFVSPVRRLAQFFEQYMTGVAGFERFLEIMRTEPEIRDLPDAKELTEVKGQIDFENVSFAYSNGVPVLSDIDLHIESGKCLAVVGPSGGGKTTLCQLLPRFYDVTDGRICIDGEDIRSFTQESLHRAIGIIQQDVFMFAGTIRDNIRYGRPDATEEEIVEAAIRAEIHKEIMEMPNGYDSYIGERGVMLSGGQKQRISIARVFLKNPKILILDEATSALDTVTEQRIQSALDHLSEGRTTIVIAHRLSTIQNADEIAVIEKEKITEMGTREELLAQNGKFAELLRAQSLAKEESK